MSAPKILFLTPELPYPPVSGGKLKSWKFLEFLSENYKVSVGSILKGDDSKNLKEFLININIEYFYSDQVNRPRTASNLIKSYFSNMPLNIFRTYSDTFKISIESVIDNYDIVISDHYEVFQYIPKSFKGKIVLHEHNAYYLMWQRYAQNKDNSHINRLASLAESIRVKNFELNACKASDIIFASPNDINTLCSLGIEEDKCKVTYHLGDDSQLNLPSINYKHTHKSLLYVGSLGWEANIDGLLWFIENTWPALIQNHPDLKFTIIGKNPDKRLIKACQNHPNIHLAGFVHNLEPYFTTHRVFVAPLRFGAGMKVKVLNAMCRGIPCVTTDIGIEGIDAENNKHVLIANTPEEMLDAIDKLLTNQSLWESIEQSSRVLIKQKYTWDALFSSMQEDIDQLIKTHKPNSTTSLQSL
jgi:glycosyltransferase involved in cell wall biosynthesis